MTYLREEASQRYPFNTKAGYDYTAWAKRIMWRHDQGDKELLPIQIAFAKEALGVKNEKQ